MSGEVGKSAKWGKYRWSVAVNAVMVAVCGKINKWFF
jgi:hypothetical protein